MEETIEAVYPWAEIILLVVPFLLVLALIVHRTINSATKYLIINSLVSTVYGLISSFIVLRIGIIHGVEGYPLWGSTALGVILGFEIYKLHLAQLVSRNVVLAKKLLENY